MLMKSSYDRKLFNALGYSLCTVVTLLCAFPFILIVSGSFTSQEVIIREGYGLFPRAPSIEAYKMAFQQPEAILRSYAVTIVLTILGTAIGLFITAMTGYALTRQDFKWRNKFAFFFYFTTLFSGGIVPWYILCVSYLKLPDTFTALLVPHMLSVFYILVMKSFMMSIPSAISESAKIDGAGDFQIFVRLILPLSKSALASIGLFIAIRYWNDWFNAYMFIQDQNLYPLQYFLYRILSGAEALKRMVDLPGYDSLAVPTEALKMAMVVVTTGPVLLLYPFIQKYFVAGLTIGAVKG